MDLTFRIPGNILPVDRGRQFADPIGAALRSAEVGELRDEGTQMGIDDGRFVVVGCDIVLRSTDVPRALEVIRRVLREAAAPAATKISEGGGSSVVHEL